MVVLHPGKFKVFSFNNTQFADFNSYFSVFKTYNDDRKAHNVSALVSRHWFGSPLLDRLPTHATVTVFHCNLLPVSQCYNISVVQQQRPHTLTEMAEMSELLIFHSKVQNFKSQDFMQKKGQTLPFGSLDFSFTVDRQMNGSPEACG